MTNEQFNIIIKWQQSRLGDVKMVGQLNKLIEEVNELVFDYNEGAFNDMRVELADCFIVLFGIANKMGMDYADIHKEIADKMIVNFARTWFNPDENGIIKHKEDNI
jgi:NTP pyrophosphatase (non-canonical NTP hydrolase)